MRKPSTEYQNPYLPNRKKRGREFLSKFMWLIFIMFVIAAVGFVLYRFQWFRIRNSYESQMRNNYAPTSSQSISAVEQYEPIQVMLIGYNQNTNLIHQPVENHLVQTIGINPQNQEILRIKFSPHLRLNLGEGQAISLISGLVHSDYDGMKSELEELVDYPIDFYLSVNFSALKDLVDHLGGIKLKPIDDIKVNQLELEANKTYELTGTEVEALLKINPNETTSEVLMKEELILDALSQALFNKNHFFDGPRMIELASQSIQTNLPFEFWQQIFRGDLMIENFTNQTLSFEGISMIENNITFEIIDENNQREIQNQVSRFLSHE